MKRRGSEKVFGKSYFASFNEKALENFFKEEAGFLQ